MPPRSSTTWLNPDANIIVARGWMKSSEGEIHVTVIATL